MKTIIVAINAKYIHSNLAVWYLKASCGVSCGDVGVFEHTINERLDEILYHIIEEMPDNIVFSCYIWNIDYIKKLAANIKKVFRDCSIILGGPEVSFDCEQFMHENPDVDYIIRGEGEEAFPMLLECLNGRNVSKREIPGLILRQDGVVKPDKCLNIVKKLDNIPSPYLPEMLSSLGGRIAYYESSRGCPFECSYCLSSTIKGMRYFSMDRVEKDLEKLIKAGVGQIKFVDRTFNCHKKRSKQIINLLLDLSDKYSVTDNINFHFEADAHLFDGDFMVFLKKIPRGLIQFEVGIQSTKSITLKEVDRRCEVDKSLENIRKIVSLGNIHLHAGLIAGLPFEDMHSFGEAFNRVFSLKAHQIQLGFLKMLKGSKIRKEADLHGYLFRDYPPYEVLSNKYMDSFEIVTKKNRKSD